MRIVVLGDFHLKEDELEWTAQCMEDIRACSPDLIVPLGDFGSNRLIGSPEGLQQSYSLLSSIDKPIRAILGNHDLQRESGNKGQEHGTMERELIRLFRQPSAYGVIEEKDFRLIFISTDPQPSDSCYQVQECYVSEQQFSWLAQTLQERKGVPVIMFTHAPPIGCGLRTVPGVHVRATNAYLDQNHDPMRWFQLFRNTPEIVVWFSAHYHLGHGYPDSSTNRLGTTFFTTGVHGSATRDGDRLSRVMDISENGIQVRTLDHRQRLLLPAADWKSTGPLGVLVSEKNKALSKEGGVPTNDNTPLTCVEICQLGDGEPLAQGIAHIGGDRWLVAANDGYLWEASVSADAILGTLHIGSPVDSVSVGREEAAYTADNRLFWVDIQDIWRFARENPDRRNKEFIEFENGITSITYDEEGLLWAASGCELFAIDTKDNESVHMKRKTCVHTFPERISRLMAYGKGLAVHTHSGALYSFINGQISLLEQDIICWDMEGTESAALINEGDNYYLTYHNAAALSKHPVHLKGGQNGAEKTQIVCLGGGYVLLHDAGVASLWNMAANVCCTVETKLKVMALMKDKNPEKKRFALAVAASGPHIRPQLQLWQYGL
ncbi:metallophosphoesterase [Paenibacillus sp. UNC451MF]|uniref:metallophosphoesterase n=1 Tax=Paenibacillus sp. UNC451MF TaxID=1449063 RepID=UPI0018CBF4C3|nr:metallophosphoesterase [Paenibacillus sp. UNC451MF]